MSQFKQGGFIHYSRNRKLREKLADPSLHRPSVDPEDEVTQAQHKLSGHCPGCGSEETKEKWGWRCFSCFVHYKNHR